jgi:outer membrane protein assembly factor BamC
MVNFMNKLKLLICVVSVVSLSACSSTSEYKAVYGEIKQESALDVPPGLDQPEENANQLPEQQVASGYYSEYTSSQGQQKQSDFLTTYKGMHFVRDGRLYWVEVNDYPEKVWPDLRNFFNKIGLKINFEQPQLGLMQTEWKENKVDAPTGGWLSGLFGRLTSSGILDSYRARLEFDEEKVITRVFISHRGMREVVEGEDNNIDVVLTKWVPRDPDPELEIEMLMRFMAFRGVDEKIAKEEVEKVKNIQRAELVKSEDTIALKVNDVFPRTWRHVGLALDRMGVLVEDRNRSAGVYYITLPDTFVIKQDSGFFSAFTDGAVKPSMDKYLLSIEDKGDTSMVLVKARGPAGDDLRMVTEKILTEIQNNIL